MAKKSDPLEFDPFVEMTKVEAEPKKGRRDEEAPDLSAYENVSDDDLRDSEPSTMVTDGGGRTPSRSNPVESTAVVPPPAKKHRALQLDFSDVLGPGGREVTGAQRIGASSLDTDEFLEREDRRALQRAQHVPTADLPSSIERDMHASGVRVVAETRRYGVLLVLMIVIPAVLVVLGVIGTSRWRAYKAAKQLEEIRQMQDLDQQMAQQREKDLARATK